MGKPTQKDVQEVLKSLAEDHEGDVRVRESIDLLRERMDKKNKEKGYQLKSVRISNLMASGKKLFLERIDHDDGWILADPKAASHQNIHLGMKDKFINEFFQNCKASFKTSSDEIDGILLSIKTSWKKVRFDLDINISLGVGEGINDCILEFKDRMRDYGHGSIATRFKKEISVVIVPHLKTKFIKECVIILQNVDVTEARKLLDEAASKILLDA